MLYPPLPASEETFIHQAVREMKADPDTINRMYEKFSQQIINDMQRKVSRNEAGLHFSLSYVVDLPRGFRRFCTSETSVGVTT